MGTKSIFRFDATGKHGKDDSDYLTIKNFVVYGSIEEDTDKDGNIIIKSLNKDIFEGDGRFSARIAKASNMKFENATFNNAHGAGSHLFDVAGSDHIVFEKLQQLVLEEKTYLKKKLKDDSTKIHILYIQKLFRSTHPPQLHTDISLILRTQFFQI